MADFIKYPNIFNSMNFSRMKAREQDLAFRIIKKYREELLSGQNSEFVVFEYEELKSILNFENRNYSRFDKFMNGVEESLINLESRFSNEHVRTKIKLFPTLVYYREERRLIVRINEDFKDILSFISEKFTLFDFEEFSKLNGNHSKTLYRVLKQWKTVGKVSLTVDEVREIFGVENHSPGEIKESVFKRALKDFKKAEIRSFEGLKFETVKNGKCIEKYVFTFKKEIPDLEEIKGSKALTGYELLPKVSLHNWLEEMENENEISLEE